MPISIPSIPLKQHRQTLPNSQLNGRRDPSIRPTAHEASVCCTENNELRESHDTPAIIGESVDTQTSMDVANSLSDPRPGNWALRNSGPVVLHSLLDRTLLDFDTVQTLMTNRDMRERLEGMSNSTYTGKEPLATALKRLRELTGESLDAALGLLHRNQIGARTKLTATQKSGFLRALTTSLHGVSTDTFVEAGIVSCAGSTRPWSDSIENLGNFELIVLPRPEAVRAGGDFYASAVASDACRDAVLRALSSESGRLYKPDIAMPTYAIELISPANVRYYVESARGNRNELPVHTVRPGNVGKTFGFRLYEATFVFDYLRSNEGFTAWVENDHKHLTHVVDQHEHGFTVANRLLGLSAVTGR